MRDLDNSTRALNQSSADMANAQSAMDEAVREANRREAAGEPPEYDLLANGEHGDDAPGGDGEDGDDQDDEITRLNALLAAPTVTPPHELEAGEEQKPAAPPPSPKEQTIMMLRIIKESGPQGILAGKVRSQLNAVVSRFGIEVSEQLFYPRLKKLATPGYVSQPWGPGPGAEPAGRWVITPEGERYLAQQG